MRFLPLALTLAFLAPAAIGLSNEPPVPAPSPETALQSAAADGDLTRVRQLLADGIDVDGQDSAGRTPLLYAVSRGHIEVARVLIDAGAAIHAQRSERSAFLSPLCTAVDARQPEILQLLLDRGAGVRREERSDLDLLGTQPETIRLNQRRPSWFNPDELDRAITRAAATDQAGMVLTLLRRRGQVGKQSTTAGKFADSALCRAAAAGRLDEVKALLAASTPPLDEMAHAYVLALQEGQVDVTSLIGPLARRELVEHERVERARETRGLHAALSPPAPYEKLVIALLRGADVNERDEQGATALHDAVFYNRLEHAELLLRHGADPTLKTNYGNSPIDGASDKPEMLQLLERYRTGRTAPSAPERSSP